MIFNALRNYYLKSRPQLSLGSGVTLSLVKTNFPRPNHYRTAQTLFRSRSYSSLMMRAKSVVSAA